MKRKNVVQIHEKAKEGCIREYGKNVSLTWCKAVCSSFLKFEYKSMEGRSAKKAKKKGLKNLGGEKEKNGK